jgi:hypothetical protein
MRIFVALGVVASALWAAPLARAEMADVVTATYGDFSLPPPTVSSIIICHGYGCRFRSEVGLTNADRGRLAQFMAAGRASADAERRAIAAAGAWFDRRIAPEAGTLNHVARAGVSHMQEAAQFDCIDSSRNTTTLLLVLEKLKLLRYHHVDAPEARGYLIDGRPPHATAVLVENRGGQSWSVDSWTRGYGQAPEIMKLSDWLQHD